MHHSKTNYDYLMKNNDTPPKFTAHERRMMTQLRQAGISDALITQTHQTNMLWRAVLARVDENIDENIGENIDGLFKIIIAGQSS